MSITLFFLASRLPSFFPCFSLWSQTAIGVDIFISILAGYVQKITARKDIDVMEDLDNGKPP